MESNIEHLTDVSDEQALAVLADGELVAMQAGVIGAEQLIEALDRLAADPSLTGAAAAGAKVAA